MSATIRIALVSNRLGYPRRYFARGGRSHSVAEMELTGGEIVGWEQSHPEAAGPVLESGDGTLIFERLAATGNPNINSATIGALAADDWNRNGKSRCLH
ncbi:hypothetical protein FFI94_018205 [Rhodococcus sp. KBS0724]|uniref:hypothetical protein n=1 Tax=Rhodococcus sp. KBS0724 TaxID=1179674 RepID=UPI00110E9A39|nr:hypothetical protein [Rhodococcus sp. KBS0724]TSD47864.1 hypothetical protein FFI94_018205 [Rhodococcus sp. KBS0724]